VISWDSKEIPWNRIENSTNPNYFSIQFSIENYSKWQASIPLSVRVISLDSKEIPWNRIENSTSPNYFSIHPLKADTRSDRYQSLCHFEWFHGIRKKSHEIVSRTRQPSLTSRYNFLSKITRSDIDVILCQFEWFHGIRKKSHEIVSRTRHRRLTSRYILLVFVKQTKHSKWHLSFCQFEWFHGIRKKSHEIVSRTRLNSSYFSINFACFFKTNKTLEVTLEQYFVSSSDFMGFERNPMKSYRELDKPKLLLDTFCLFL
jgi:hypothetical protein